ncbi:SWIM-type domain-containing protein [Citrus sinensis]|uniref:SWIM-type domain-containing protein n=1 Tax=Citrus sinensis TaxID=2711 RepID=A0ACB8KBP8_CITSI|nr:SWIM-type domain-containing protein [Citrus sinensis]
MVKYGHNEMDLIEFFVVLPWTTSRLGGQSCHESVVIGSENLVNIDVSMGSDKFEKLSEDGFIEGHSSDEENCLSQMYESIVDNEWKPNLNGSVSLKVGNTFESVALLREVMVKYAIQEGFELNRIKNDGVRYIKGKHECQIKSVNKDATAPWIAKVCAGLIQTNPGVGVNVIRSADHIACYGKLLKYAHILMKMNRGACVKGPYRGVLLSAIALDTDSGIFPLAFCICEVENYDSWGYFLSLLYEFIGADDHRPVTIISDRQKGLLCGLEKYWPNASTRYCARHIFANLKCKFPGLNVMGFFWKACRATNQYDFERAMSQIRAKDQNCYEWLRKIPPAQWSRSGFDHHVKSDHVTNTMTESFNKWVDEVRDKPVLTILEHIRRQLMVRMLKKYQLGETWQDHLTPYARERLNQSSNEARRIKVFGGRGELFECCQAGYRNFLVHIIDGTCECGMWQVSGVPCKHAVAAILHKGGQPENYVHHYLTKESFMMTYMGTINPIPDECAWPEVEAEPSPDVVVPVKVRPPDIKALVGRPKKKRMHLPAQLEWLEDCG